MTWKVTKARKQSSYKGLTLQGFRPKQHVLVSKSNTAFLKRGFEGLFIAGLTQARHNTRLGGRPQGPALNVFILSQRRKSNNTGSNNNLTRWNQVLTCGA